MFNSTTEFKRATVKLRQNYIKSMPDKIFGGFHNEEEYYDIDPTISDYTGSQRLYPINSPAVIMIERSSESIQMTLVPEYSYIGDNGLFECLGGFCTMIFFFCKIFVGSIEKKMVEAELIKSFYQVEKDDKE